MNEGEITTGLRRVKEDDDFGKVVTPWMKISEQDWWNFVCKWRRNLPPEFNGNSTIQGRVTSLLIWHMFLDFVDAESSLSLMHSSYTSKYIYFFRYY